MFRSSPSTESFNSDESSYPSLQLSKNFDMSESFDESGFDARSECYTPSNIEVAEFALEPPRHVFKLRPRPTMGMREMNGAPLMPLDDDFDMSDSNGEPLPPSAVLKPHFSLYWDEERAGASCNPGLLIPSLLRADSFSEDDDCSSGDDTAGPLPQFPRRLQLPSSILRPKKVSMESNGIQQHGLELSENKKANKISAQAA